MRTLLQDARYGLRLLLKNPGFSVIAVLTMALGIGANTAVFSLVHAILLSPLPYSNPAELVQMTGSLPKGGFVFAREQSRSVELAGFSPPSGFNLTGAGEAVRIEGVSVSAEFFTVLGAQAERGRVLQSGEDLPGRDSVAVLSHSLWLQRFGGDPSIVGKSIVLDDVAREVVGVMPRDFRFPSPQVQIWAPLTLDPSKVGEYWGSGFVRPIGRLRNGFTVQQAGPEFAAFGPQIRAMFPWRMPDAWGAALTAIPLQESLTSDLQPRLFLLFAAVGLVLLIACANAANLLIGSAATRRQEIAIRTALGAGRFRLVRQLLTESVVVAVAGGLLGLLMASQALTLLKAILPADTPRIAEAELSVEVLWFTAGMAVFTGLLFGILPALRAARPIKSSRTYFNRASSMLVVGEIAVSLVLVIGAALLIRNLSALASMDPGFRTDHVLTARITPGEGACREPAGCNRLYDELLEQVRNSPGVQAAGATQSLPLDEVYPLALATGTHPVAPGESPYESWNYVVTPGYFPAMSIPVLRGRGIEEFDAANSQPVVVISAGMAEYFWPGQDAIGQRVRRSWESKWYNVVGVVGNVQSRALTETASDERHAGEIYFARTQAAFDRPMSIAVRTSTDPLQIADEIRKLSAAIDPDVPVSRIRLMEEVAFAALAGPRSLTWLLTAFAGLALLLGSAGVYGVVAQSVAERTSEIGIRMALGARSFGILGMIAGQALKLTAVGAAIGLTAAYALTRTLSSFLQAVTPVDAVAYSAAVFVLSLSALAASCIPAWRAARVDPVAAIRANL